MSFNLTDFVPAGSQIYIGFREHVLDNFNDGSAIMLDNVYVGPATRSAQPVAYNLQSQIGRSNGQILPERGVVIGSGYDAAVSVAAGASAELMQTGGAANLLPGGYKANSTRTGRTLLHDNGPFINSPGTGPDGSDESILQNSTLGMNTLGAGIQYASGNRMADDVVVPETWNVESITVYAYQTGSTTTSTMTGGYIQVWDGDPTQGGQIIWGDMTTNRMTATGWTNTYRRSETTPGTTRPIMYLVLETPGLTLEPGTYWIDYSLAGSLASGPWAPPITINGQAVTGNAKQFLGSSQTWQDFLDTGTGTPAQGLPFLIEGTVGGGGGGSYVLSGYNIYRDGALIATNPPSQRSYMDSPLQPGTYTYGVTATYTEPQVGESDPVTATVTIANSVDVNMQNGTVTACNGNFYDSGGPTGQYQNNENFTLTFLPATPGAKMKFNFTEFNTEANYDFLKVFDGPNTSSPQIGPANGFNGVGVPPLLVELIATNAEGAITFVFTSDGSITRDGWKATFSCLQSVDNDLSAFAISGNLTPTVGQASDYTVVVKNLGLVAQNNYTVQLKDSQGNVLGSVAGPTIQPGESANAVVSWTPSAPGPMTIFGHVDLQGDQNPDNNTTAPLNVVVQPSGIVAITIGGQTTLPTYRIPFDFYWKNSLAQTLFYPDELNNTAGAITGINLFNNFATNLPGKEVKIWMGTTTQPDLSDGWVDPSTLTLVFDGTVDFPIGANTIFIPFNQPYIYTGGNLVLYTYRVWEDQYFNSNDKFYVTETPNKPNRTRHVQADATVYDPTNPPAPAATQLKNGHPDITLFFNTSGLGALQGVVSNPQGAPVEGVKVQIVGTSSITYTNAQGQYNFPYVIAGQINVEFSKLGYITQTQPATITADQTTTLNVTLQPMPQVTVSGFVAGNDAPTVGLEGAAVVLEGYQNYNATTGANGQFSIAGVYANQTYTIKVTKDGYQPYQSTVQVGGTNLTLPNIILTEIILSPKNLTATISPTNPNLVQLQWNMIQEVEFRYDDGVSTGQLGFQSGTTNGVIGAKHPQSATLSELSWYLTSEGGPHASIVIRVFGLDAQGMPNSANVLYEATVTNVDNQWNTHTLPQPIVAQGGFFIGVAYNGFVGIATDDGVGEPWVFQDGTHYYNSNYTSGAWSTFESLGADFRKNCLIRAKGAPGAVNSYAITPPIINGEPMSYIPGKKVETGEPAWSNNESKALQYFKVYKNGQLLASNITEMLYSYMEMQLGQHCYHVTAVYGSGESGPSNEACVNILVGVDEQLEAATSLYPNPASEAFSIRSLPMQRVTITNAVGVVVSDAMLSGETMLKVHTESWKAGVYLIQIHTDKGTITKRLVVVR
ncbi:MAG: carboxypeptidase regulatory-like domain-containing protein [Bacteroidetes bacterium]|nr:carboxypeptidase regulatory-like domain-containing protein [Bacteroidota bacterium]